MKIHSAQSVSFKENMVNKPQAKTTHSAVPAVKTENKPLPSSKKDNTKAKTIGVISGAVVLVGAALYAFRERLGLVKIVKKESKNFQDEFKREVENKTEVIKEEIITQAEKGKEKAREVIQEIKIKTKRPQVKTQTEAQAQVQKIKESAQDTNFEEVIQPVATEVKAKAEEVIQPVATEVKAKAEEVIQPVVTEVKAKAEEVIQPIATEAKTAVQEAKPVAEEVKKTVQEANDATEEIRIAAQEKKPTQKPLNNAKAENVAPKSETITAETAKTQTPASKKTVKAEQVAQAKQIKPIFADKVEEYINSGKMQADILDKTAVAEQMKLREYWLTESVNVVVLNEPRFNNNNDYFKEIYRIAKDFEKDAHHPITNPNGRKDSVQQAANIIERAYTRKFFDRANCLTEKQYAQDFLAEVAKPDNLLRELYSKLPFETVIDRIKTFKVHTLSYTSGSAKNMPEVYEKLVRSIGEYTPKA